MGKNDGVIIIGGIAALFLLSAKDENGQPLISFGDLLSGGDLPSIGMPELGGLGGETGLGGFLDNLGAGLANMFGGIGAGIGQIPTFKLPDMSGGTSGTTPNQAPHQEPSQGGGFWNTPIVQPTGNVFTDAGNSISQTAMSLAKAGVVGLGIYAGAKVAMPVLSAVAPPLGKALAMPVSQVGANIARTASSGTRVIASSAGNVAKVLTSPVGKLAASPLGKVGVVGAAISAGAAGFAVGSWFNTTPAGQALIEKSGEAGAAFAKTGIGSAVFGTPAQLNTVKTDAAFSKIGLNTTEVRNLLSQGFTPAQIVSGSYKGQSSFSQATNRIVGGAR